MAIYDSAHQGYRIFIGDLGSRVGKHEIERELEYYGPILDVWVARGKVRSASDYRNPPGFAFVVFKYPEDAEKAVRDIDGRTLCGRRVRVEHARPYESRRRGGPPPGRSPRRSPRRSPLYRARRSRSRSRSRSRDRKRSRRHRSRSHSQEQRRSSKKHRSRSRSKSQSRSKSSKDKKSSRRKSDEKQKTAEKNNKQSPSRSASDSPNKRTNGDSSNSTEKENTSSITENHDSSEQSEAKVQSDSVNHND